MRFFHVIVVSALFILCVRCGAEESCEVDTQGISYSADAGPIFDEHCTRCHAVGLAGADRGGAPEKVNLDTYEGASASAERAAARIGAGTMPPAGPVGECEARTIEAWAEAGAPQ